VQIGLMRQASIGASERVLFLHTGGPRLYWRQHFAVPGDGPMVASGAASDY